jgi:hypothetical protein
MRVSPNKQLQRTVIPRRSDGGSAPFHCALAPRFTRPLNLASQESRAVEVTLQLKTGGRRWCYFMTPAASGSVRRLHSRNGRSVPLLGVT